MDSRSSIGQVPQYSPFARILKYYLAVEITFCSVNENCVIAVFVISMMKLGMLESFL